MKLLLPDYLMDRLSEPVCQIAPECALVPFDATGHVAADLQDAEALFLRWGIGGEHLQRLLAELPRLRWVHTISVGVEHVIFPGLAESDVILTNASGVFDIPIAETVLTYMLMVVKRMPEFLAQQRARRWQKQELRELRGMTVGIVGLGSIGSEIARLCRPLGMRVLGLRRGGQPSHVADEVLPPERLSELLARSDFVVIAAPLTAETRGLIGAAELAAMKPDAWLINIARGPIVDEAALIEALQARRIGGACLDVFDEEPLPENHPLWGLDNVILTPHNSWSSPYIEERSIGLFLENLRRYVNGEPLLNVVDKRVGY